MVVAHTNDLGRNFHHLRREFFVCSDVVITEVINTRISPGVFACCAVVIIAVINTRISPAGI